MKISYPPVVQRVITTYMYHKCERLIDSRDAKCEHGLRGGRLQLRKSNYSSSSLNVHLMFPLFSENRKSIQNSFSGKKLFKKCNPLDFKFYHSKSTNKNFPRMA